MRFCLSRRLPCRPSGFINEGRPGRNIPEALRPVEADADRYGTGALRHRGHGAQARGNRGGGPGRAVPYFISVDPDDMWDRGLGERGLAWAVVHGEEMERPAAFAVPLRYETLTV